LLSLIVALDKSRAIGLDGQLPWTLSRDLQRFKKLTLGHPIIMGRKTFESIGGPLPGRQNIVLTRDNELSFDGIDICGSLEEALESVRLHKKDDIFIIGGAEIYNQGLAKAGRIYLTEVEASVNGDTYFPTLVEDDWIEVENSGLYPADDCHTHAYRFRTLERKNVPI
jgi:dihydrofolate reductase